MAARALAAFLTAAAFAGSFAYVVAHPKNASAPLQPPVASRVAASAAPTAPLVTGQTPRATPRITLQPGVRATELQGITITHVS